MNVGKDIAELKNMTVADLRALRELLEDPRR